MKTLVFPEGTWTYSDQKPLGTPGGFAAVYPGMSEGGDPVAIKIFHSADPATSRRELQFAQERLGKNDAHVIPILGCGIDPQTGHACIVMSRADHSLADKLAKDGTLDEAAAVSIALQVVNGLLAVRPWVHRDLKPGNVLFCDGRWQLADFGIARQADASTAASTMKDYMSAQYAAPEQWNGERATTKTDVYALSCMLQEMLSGSPPFDGPDWPDFAEQHRRDSPKGLAGSDRMKSILGLMLNKSPATRPELTELAKRFSEWGVTEAAGGSLGALAQAAARVSAQKLEQGARAAASEVYARDRATIQADALREMAEITELLIDQITFAAPGATVSGLNRSMRAVSLGSGQLSIWPGRHPSIRAGMFAASGWDVICGGDIKVTQANGTGRSASLWYARRWESAPYEWIEVSYWSLRGTATHEPCALEPGRDADYAASNIMHTWQHAHDPRSLRDAGREQFVERWIAFFAAAVDGRLQRPSSLPER